GADMVTLNNPNPAAGLTTLNFNAGPTGTVVNVQATAATVTTNLRGGAGADTFIFATGGSVAGNVDRKGGDNTPGCSALGSPTSRLTATGTDGFNGTAGPVAGGFANIDSILGSSAGTTDRLTGLNAPATWTISSPNGGTYASTNSLTFSKVENLNGGSDTDA